MSTPAGWQDLSGLRPAPVSAEQLAHLNRSVTEAFEPIRKVAVQMRVSLEALSDTLAIGKQMSASIANGGRRCTAITSTRAKRCARKGIFTDTPALFRCWQHPDSP